MAKTKIIKPEVVKDSNGFILNAAGKICANDSWNIAVALQLSNLHGVERMLAMRVIHALYGFIPSEEAWKSYDEARIRWGEILLIDTFIKAGRGAELFP